MRAVFSSVSRALVLLALLAATANAQETPPPATQPPPASPPPATSSAPPPAISASGNAAPVMNGVSIWGILPWGGLGVGARYMLPLPITPLLSRTKFRDSWGLEFGADFLHWSYDYGGLGSNFAYSRSAILPVVGMMWTVWFNEQWALYPKVEAGYYFDWFSGWDDTAGARPGYASFFASGAGGAIYRINSSVTLRGELGVSGAKLGAGWLF